MITKAKMKDSNSWANNVMANEIRRRKDVM